MAGLTQENSMSAGEHWQSVYQQKATDAVSWYRPHLELSVELIEKTGVSLNAPIIDIGGGASTLVDDLLVAHYQDVTVLDLSDAAFAVTRQRLGDAAARVQWRVADIAQVELPAAHYGLWHDRAVFHFMTQPVQREAYIRTLLQSLRPDGHLIMATFGPAGPERCSGLPVCRYDAESLVRELGDQFQLRESRLEWHQTPLATQQQFLYVWLQRVW